MLTDWKIIAQRVSDNLNIPIEEVESDILKYSENLRAAYREGTSLEYDHFYIGKLVMSSHKLLKYWNNLKKYPEKKNYPIIKNLIEQRDKIKGNKVQIRKDTNEWHRKKYPKHY